MIGKTNSVEFKVWENDFVKRIKGFTNFSIEVFENIKNIRDPQQLKLEESKKIISRLKRDDFLILLDEKGKTYNSKSFASFMEKITGSGSSKRIIFLIGGAFGFHNDLYERSDSKLSMSEMTFSHQLIRVLFLEQLYRAYAIINNHPYHNE